MSSLAFFDTNVLVYADDASARKKRERAIALIVEHRKRNSLVISLQVLQEYFAVATRKLGVAAEIAQRKVEVLARGNVIRFTERDVIAAIELHRLIGVSFWDAMIVHAARAANAAVLYSEDMGHGSVLGGVPIQNPFLDI